MRVLFSAILGISLLAVMAASGLRAAGEADVLFVGSGSAEVGDETTVTLGVAEIADPPNSAWTIDITYDRTIVSAVSCEALSGSVCSPAFADDMFRSIGAIAAGIEAPMDFAHLTFLCEQSGESPLSMSVSVWSDATMPIGREKVEIEEGTITCAEPADLITISSLDLEVGQQGTVVVEAERVAQPGVGAWTLDISYDSSVVSFLGCVGGDLNVGASDVPTCGDEAPSSVRVIGVSAEGLQPGTVLAELELRCDRPGETDLRTDVDIWSVASIAVPGQTPGVEVRDGSITCGMETPAKLPSTGGAEPREGSPLATVPLAVLGAVLLAAAFAFRRYALPR